MLIVFKYPFGIEDEFEVEMPEEAEIVLVECQDNQPCIWAKVNTEAVVVARKFYLTGTGHELPHVPLSHVASFQQGQFVRHLWESQ